MTPPNRRLPKAIALVLDLTATVPRSTPSAPHSTTSSLKLRCTVTEPGVVAYQVPLSLTSEQRAPVTSAPRFLLTTQMLWFWPLTIEAQPPQASKASAAKAATAERIVIGSSSLRRPIVGSARGGGYTLRR